MISFRSLQFVTIFAVLLALTVCFAEICPDHKKSCRKGQTCCDDKQGGYGCCPYENATCCSDGLHCCPTGTSCDLAAGRCRRNKQLPLVAASNFVDTSENEIEQSYNRLAGNLSSSKQECPDRKQTCPLSYTCCQDPQEGYSCCPYENATCCPDRIHCCPHGSTCGSGSCQ